MEYCYHIWVSAAKFSLSIHDNVQKRLYIRVGDEHFPTYNPFPTDKMLKISRRKGMKCILYFHKSQARRLRPVMRCIL